MITNIFALFELIPGDPGPVEVHPDHDGPDEDQRDAQDDDCG